MKEENEDGFELDRDFALNLLHHPVTSRFRMERDGSIEEASPIAL